MNIHESGVGILGTSRARIASGRCNTRNHADAQSTALLAAFCLETLAKWRSMFSDQMVRGPRATQTQDKWLANLLTLGNKLPPSQVGTVGVARSMFSSEGGQKIRSDLKPAIGSLLRAMPGKT